MQVLVRQASGCETQKLALELFLATGPVSFAQMRTKPGVNNTAGAALVEAYELDQQVL